LGASVLDDTDDKFLSAGVLATQPEKQSTGIRSLAVGTAIATSIAIVVGIMFLQNRDAHIDAAITDATIAIDESDALATSEPDDPVVADSSNSILPDPDTGNAANTSTSNAIANVSATTAIADSTAASTTTDTLNNAATDALATSTSFDTPPINVVTNQTTNTAAVTQENSAPVEPVLAALTSVYFDKPVPNDPQSDSPRTIMELTNSVSQFSPIEGMDGKFWKEKGCSDCHNWTRESLCQQGDFYADSDDSMVSRIQHPFGGYFKQALKNWAGNDCS